jgi:integrase
VKAKPKGAKYRNLTARGGRIYYQRRVGKRRIRFSCETDDWETAAQAARLYEERKGIGRPGFVIVEAPTLRAFAKRYLEEDTGHLAETTLHDRRRYLAARDEETGEEDGRLMAALGDLRLDALDARRLREWWNAEGFGAAQGPKLANGRTAPRTIATGRTYLDALAGVFVYAREIGLVEANPIDELRDALRRRTRTRRGRAEASADRNVHPIEDPKELGRFVTAARAHGLEAYAFVLLGLDAGLRRGEALGLRWGRIVWGEDEDDPSRALLVVEARPRGGAFGPPKSGRARRVALSTRLRGALLSLYRLHDGPPADAPVIRGGFHRREWKRLEDAAGIGHRRFKDLRDTFGSQLVSAGVPLAYVSRQLGHADVAVTARHYARWTGGDEYREPVRLLAGEVPADLLARLAVEPEGSTDRAGDPRVTPGEGADALPDGASVGNC